MIKQSKTRCDVCKSQMIKHEDEYFGYIDKTLNQKVTHHQEYDRCIECGNVLRGTTKLVEREEVA